jgi:hypothetical protein
VASRCPALACGRSDELLRGEAQPSGGSRAVGGKVEVAAWDNREARRRWSLKQRDEI